MEQSLLKLGHDVRQTLHHVTGLLELIGEEPLSRSQSQYLSRCRVSADHLIRRTNDLSVLMNAEDLPGEATTIAIRQKVAEIAELMLVLATDKGLDASWTVDPVVPEWVVADSDLIQDSLRRVLDNAIRFTEEGSVRLSVTPAQRPGKDAVLIFEIADTGPGIPADVRADLESAIPLPRCAGLGLAVVRKRLETAGGSISIVSGTAQGSIVRLSLPVSIPSGHQAPTNGAPSTYSGSPASRRAVLRLLVAEDSDDSFFLLQLYLKDTGWRISRARDGERAVELAKSGPYDLIIMDANMPVMDGYDATRTIREWETERGRSRTPILLISADDRSRQKRIGALVGCSGYLAKPTSKAEILAAVDFFTAEYPAGGGAPVG